MGREGIAPEEIIASRVTDGMVTRTRPICAYPQVARYAGSGSIDDAANSFAKSRGIATANTTTEDDQL